MEKVNVAGFDSNFDQKDAERLIGKTIAQIDAEGLTIKLTFSDNSSFEIFVLEETLAVKLRGA